MKYVKIKYYDNNRKIYKTDFAIKTTGRRGCLLYRLIDDKKNLKNTIPETLLVSGLDQLIWERPAEYHHTRGVLVTPTSRYWKSRNKSKSIPIISAIQFITKRFKK